jgi:hypothetical protein
MITGPFLFMGRINATVLLFAIYVKLAHPSRTSVASSPAS